MPDAYQGEDIVGFTSCVLPAIKAIEVLKAL
jgi:hypothetical protein